MKMNTKSSPSLRVKWMRYLVLAVALCFLMVVGAPRAQALLHDPSDYIVGTYYQGVDKFVTIELPVNAETVHYQFWSGGKWQFAENGTHYTFTVNQGNGYDLSFVFTHLDVSDFPDSTRLEVDVKVDVFNDYIDSDSLTGVSMLPIVQFYDKNYKWKSQMETYPVYDVNLNGYTNLTTALYKDTDIASVGVKVSGFTTDDVRLGTEVSVSLTNLRLSFSVSALIEFMDKQNLTNSILNNLLYADPEVLSMVEAYRDKANGLGHKVDGMTGALAPGDIGKIAASDFDMLSLLPSGFTPILSTLSVFTSNDIISIMLTLTAMCAVVGYLFFGKKG